MILRESFCFLKLCVIIIFFFCFFFCFFVLRNNSECINFHFFLSRFCPAGV